MSDTDRLKQARLLYEGAVFGGDASAIEHGMRELDKVEADLALPRGRLLHANFLEARLEQSQAGLR
jgi:hypothetical protein